MTTAANGADVYRTQGERSDGVPRTSWGRWKGALETFAHRSKFNVALSVARMDAWVNEVTGFGTRRDKNEHGYIFPSRRLTDQELSALYHSDDMAARMVDIVPQEMMREGFEIQLGDPELDAILSDKFDALDVRGKFLDGLRWGRGFGGAAALIGADDGRDAVLPLIPERADDIDYLYIVDRRLLWPTSWYDEPGHPMLGLPKTYLVTTVGGTVYNTAEVHESRLIIFRGAPTGIRERMELVGWDLSVLQRAYEALRSFNSGWRAVETILVDGFQSIFKMTGLTESIASGDEKVLQARLRVVDLYRSVMRAMVIDADAKESFERTVTPLTGIPDTLDKIMLRLAAAVQIPVTIMMGQSPAGMNATGESDFRWFYDRIRSEQTTNLSPKLRRLTSVWLATKKGRELVPKPPKTIKIKFPPLWTETPLAQAQREYQVAQSDALYIQSQVLTPEEVAVQRMRPGGMSVELVLSPEGLEAREKAIEVDVEKMQVAEPEIPPELEERIKALEEGLVDPSSGKGWQPGESKPEPPDLPDDEESFGFKLDAANIPKGNEAAARIATDRAKSATKGERREAAVASGKAEIATAKAQAAMAEARKNPGLAEAQHQAAAAMKAAAEAHVEAGSKWAAVAAKSSGGIRVAAESKVMEHAHGARQMGAASNDHDATVTSITSAAQPGAKPPAHEGGGSHDQPRDEQGRFTSDAMSPRRFRLMRAEDETGVSGTGHVADGVEFPDGRVALRWRTRTASTTLFDSMAHVLEVHGHGGKTTAEYLDDERYVPKGSPVLGSGEGSGPVD